ncbi:hypothetical protein GCM10028778_26970 [Barrientosiimonas marina]
MIEDKESENKFIRRFKLIFHTFVLIFAIGITFDSIASWNELNRELLNLILGIVLGAASIYGLYKNYTNSL